MVQKRIQETAKHRRRSVEVAPGEWLVIEDRPDFVDTEERDEHKADVDDDVLDILDEIDGIQAENAEAMAGYQVQDIGSYALHAELMAEREETERILARTALYAA